MGTRHHGRGVEAPGACRHQADSSVISAECNWLGVCSDHPSDMVAAPPDRLHSLRIESPPRGARANVTPEQQEIYRTPRQYPLFDGIPNDVMGGAIASGELSLRAWYRDDIVADAETLRAAGPLIYL